jgi:dTDP-4-dehydrorhamnose reductase
MSCCKINLSTYIPGAKCNISPINTEGYSAAAKRPKFSVMSKEKISKEFDLKIISWKEYLKYCMNNLSTAPTLSKD